MALFSFWFSWLPSARCLTATETGDPREAMEKSEVFQSHGSRVEGKCKRKQTIYSCNNQTVWARWWMTSARFSPLSLSSVRLTSTDATLALLACLTVSTRLSTQSHQVASIRQLQGFLGPRLQTPLLKGQFLATPPPSPVNYRQREKWVIQGRFLLSRPQIPPAVPLSGLLPPNREPWIDYLPAQLLPTQ